MTIEFFEGCWRLLRLILLFFVAVFTLPIGIIVFNFWGPWQKTKGLKKVIFGIFLVPAAAYLIVMTQAWEKL